MAEAAPATAPPPPVVPPEEPAGPQLVAADPAERGTLDVRTKAIQHIVERAVLDTPGTVAHQGALGKLIGTGSPRASITMEGRRARVEVDVAAVWPSPVTRIATDVRDRVLHEAVRQSGVFIRTVDVTVHLVTPDAVDHQQRRVQ
ncbi:Asp23/Gls24 family envelope stress response protein [Nocardioides sp. Soil777]|uniref:Asp23/Gls24 family envelope stress response protein n=1 Tax=Nocardioides sp. Soil777 TaxID=1736409 RepID=UPI0012F9E526|nr:Asp23/Gls24 family envelope stress response protein [Nocardioides sp. Soil777]